MKLWLTSSEIADLALPGLPETDRGIRMLAEREDWARFSALCRQRAGRGGGLEYHVNLLPVAARVAYFGAAAPAPVAGAALQAAPEPAAGATSAATLQLDARLAVLGALKAFIRSSEMKQTVAISYFVDLYNLGKVELPAWAAAILPRLSTRTVLRWLSASREGETGRLAVDRGAGRRGQGVLDAAFDGEIKHFAIAVHSLNDLYTASHIYGAVKGEFEARLSNAGLSLPGQRAFEIRFNTWKQEYAAGLLKMMDPDGFRSKMKVSGSYAHMAPHLNALWQIDASPVDAMCVDGRHSIYVCIDYWSRRIILFVSKTPRSEAVQLLMRKAILAWGVPDAVKTDNGSDFVARATVRLFARLQIEAIRSDAFSPWQKGVVERNIRTFQTDCARMLPGFVGHNVAQRKKIEGRKAFSQRLGQENEAFNVTLTGDDLQAICDHWAADMYAHLERADAKLLSASLTNQLIQLVIALNFGPQAKYPRLNIGRPDEVPLKDIVDALDKLGPLGLTVEASEVRDRLGFSDPAKPRADGKPVELIGGRPPPPPAPALPGLGAPLQPGSGKPGEIEQLRHLVSRHASAPEPEFVDRLTEGLAEDAAGALAGLTGDIRDAFDAATDMADLADRLARLALDPGQLVLGPDPCGRDTSLMSLADRRQLAHQRWTGRGGASRAYFIGLAAKRGVTITISENRVSYAGEMVAGDEIVEPPEQFIWTVHLSGITDEVLFEAGEGQAGDRLYDLTINDIECDIRRLKPAHTEVVFDYGSP